MTTKKQLDRLGELVDKADNFVHAAKLPLPAPLHKEQLAKGMADIRDELRKLYVEIADDDPWDIMQ